MNEPINLHKNNGWHRVKIKDIGKVIRGASPRPQGDPRYYGGSIPRLMGADVTRDGKYVTPQVDFLTRAGASLSRPVPAGTLTVVCSGVVGVPSFLAVDACIHDGFLAIMDISERCNKEYLYYVIDSLQTILERSATHGGVFTNLTTEILREFEFFLPPLSEQEELARILTAWDDAISNLSSLIKAKTRLKRALMQQLLTGERRFREFETTCEKQKTKYGLRPRDWADLPIREFAFEVNQRSGEDEPLPVLSCTKHAGLVDSLKYFGKQIYSESLAAYKVVRRNQFAYATNHIEEGSIGLLTEIEAGVVSPMYTVFGLTDKVHPPFLYALFKTEMYRHIFASNTSASVDRRGSLRWHQFSQIQVALPTLAERNYSGG